MRRPLADATKSVLDRMGYQIRRKDDFDIHFPAITYGYDHEMEARAAVSKVRSRTMVSYLGLVSLYQQVRHCEVSGVEGDYVECGTWKGGAVGLMALANMAHGKVSRRLHLFDAFDDICEPDPSVDGERALADVAKFSNRERDSLAGRLAPLSGVYEHLGGPGVLEDVQNFLERDIGCNPSRCVYHKGWFQDTLPQCGIETIAILRLDGDWYASTKTCLNHLYDRVVPGGFVIVDDYGHYDGCRKAVDEFLAENGLRSFLSHVDRSIRYWVKG